MSDLAGGQLAPAAGFLARSQSRSAPSKEQPKEQNQRKSERGGTPCEDVDLSPRQPIDRNGESGILEDVVRDWLRIPTMTERGLGVWKRAEREQARKDWRL